MGVTYRFINGQFETVGANGFAYDTMLLPLPIDSPIRSPVGRAATKIIASSAAAFIVKVQADVLLTGASDDIAINAAINAAALTNGTVIIIGPTVSLTNHIILKNNVHLVLDNVTISASTTIDYAIGDGGTAVTNAVIEAKGETSIDATNMSWGYLFETATSNLIFRGLISVTQAKDAGIFIDHFNSLYFDTFEVTGISSPGTNKNRGVVIKRSQNIFGSRIIVRSCGNYIGTTYYNAIEFYGETYYGYINYIYSDGSNISTFVIGNNVHDFQFGTYHGIGSVSTAIAGTIPDNINLINIVHDVSFDKLILQNAKSNSIAIGGGTGGVYNIQIGQIIASGAGGASICIGQATGELVYNIQIGNAIAFNNAQDLPSGQKTGMLFSNCYDIQINSYRAFDAGGNTQTYPVIFYNATNHTLDRIRFGLTDFNSSPVTIPLYTVAADVTGRTLPFINSGTATVSSGATTKVVTHGLANTPTRVFLTPSNSSGSATKWWVNTLSSTGFTINVDADPGVATAIFDWRALIGEGN